jgi:hypothetical protein
MTGNPLNRDLYAPNDTALLFVDADEKTQDHPRKE